MDLTFYPAREDKDFDEILFRKREFNTTKYPVGYYDNVTIEEKCNAETFNVENHQLFLRRFMSPETPYKSLLLFHGVGTGKTCAALTIAEGYKASLTTLRKRLQVKRGTRNFVYYNYPGVYVISSRAIHKVFRNELYNTNKVSKEETPGILHCVGNEYFPLNDDADTSNKKLQVSRKILSYYSFFGPSEFSNFVRDIKKVTTLEEFFSHSIFIIDEVHNVISEEKEANETVTTLETLKEVFKETKNTRLVILSATPMRDVDESIVDILTLLRYNDKNYEPVSITKLFENDSINEEYLKELTKGYVSYLRGNNPISFPRIKTPKNIYKPNPQFKINGEIYEYDDRIYELFKCVMEQFQFDVYLNIKQTEGLRPVKLLEASTIVFPSGEVGDKGFEETFKKVKDGYGYKHSDTFLLEENIKKYSSKIHELLVLARTTTGLHYIYSQFDKSGAFVISMAFEANGYACYSKNGKFNEQGKYINGRKLLYETTRKYRCSVCGNLDNQEHVDHNFKQGVFVLFTGTEIAGVPDALQVFNSFENKDGHLIKFVIGSLVSAEGVDYKRVKHVHILNPWHNYTRTWQAIGRGLRNCSQVDFPEEEREVTVYLYSASTLDEPKTESIDEQLYRRSLDKDIRIKAIERILKENAIDCALNKEANIYASDKDYTRDCDYQKCDYTCNYVPPKEVIIDEDTFTIKYDDPEVTKASNLIFLLFKKRSFYSLDEILNEVHKNVDKEYVFVALTKLLSKPNILRDAYKRPGSLISKNGYYFYQPTEFQDNSAPLRYKESPLLLKTTGINVMAKPKILLTPKIEEPVVIKNNIESLLRNVLLQPSLELMSYMFDRNDESTILQMTELLIKKSDFVKIFVEEKFSKNCVTLLEYLHRVKFILVGKVTDDSIYWESNNKAYIGHVSTYWNKTPVRVKVLSKENVWTTYNEVSKNIQILDDNGFNDMPKKLASQSDCYLHGIISFVNQYQFKILYNPTMEAMKSTDQRRISRGKDASSYKSNELKQFLKCIDKSQDTVGLNKNQLIKQIELVLRNNEFNNKNNVKWIERT